MGLGFNGFYPSGLRFLVSNVLESGLDGGLSSPKRKHVRTSGARQSWKLSELTGSKSGVDLYFLLDLRFLILLTLLFSLYFLSLPLYLLLSQGFLSCVRFASHCVRFAILSVRFAILSVYIGLSECQNIYKK